MIKDLWHSFTDSPTTGVLKEIWNHQQQISMYLYCPVLIYKGIVCVCACIYMTNKNYLKISMSFGFCIADAVLIKNTMIIFSLI